MTFAFYLLPVEILVPKLDAQGTETGDLKSASKLAIGTLENSFDSSADLKSDWIEADTDRFYIRVTDPGHSANGPIKVRVWTDSEDDEYDDDDRSTADSNVVELYEEGSTGVFTSKSLLLTSNDGDDGHVVDGVADNAKNDRTRMIALGGKLKVEFLEYKQAATYNADIEAEVPIEKTVKLKVWVAKTSLFGAPVRVVSPEAVQDDIRVIKESLAQAGVKVTVHPTTVEFADSDAGISLSPSGFEIELTDEAKALFDWVELYSQRASDEISVFYVNFTTHGWVTGGDNGPRGLSYIAKLFSPAKYANHIVIAANHRLRYTASHEMLHILLNATHPPGSNDYPQEWSNIRMMWAADGVSNEAGINGRKRISKRLFGKQAPAIKGSPYAK